MFQQTQQEPHSFVRYGIRILAVVTGLLCFIVGFVVAISTSVGCIFAGIFLIVTGAFILLYEAPFCCAFLPQTVYITKVTDKMGPLVIGIIYAVCGIITLAMCVSISTIFSCIFLFATAALRIRDFILARRARSQAGGISTIDTEAARNQPPAYTGGPYPAYGQSAPYPPAGGIGDQVAAGAARGAAEGFKASLFK